jgi:peptidoglycan/LPS O-acetylase OafA/YrhL
MAVPPGPGKRLRLEGVDALRGLAALWVALSHYLPHWNDRGGHAWIIVPHDWGVYAVELFFVISGFVIFMTLEKCAGVLDFAVLRFSRLFPAYWATMAFAAVMGHFLFHAPLWPLGLLANATMLHEFLGFRHFDNVYWSLSAELAFYAHAAWVFGLGWHRKPMRLVLVWLALAAGWALWLRAPGAGARGEYALLFDFDYAPFFAMGIVFYDALRNGWGPRGAVLIGICIAVEGLIGGARGCEVAGTLALLFLAATSVRIRLPGEGLLLWMGGVSYTFYLIHRNLGYDSLDWLKARGLSAGAAVSLVLAGALALAWAFSLGVERPALAALRGRWESARERRLRRGLAKRDHPGAA